MVGNAKESSGRGRKPSAIRVRSAAENFAAHAASPYRPHQCRQSLNTTKTEYIFVNGVAGFVIEREKSNAYALLFSLSPCKMRLYMIYYFYKYIFHVHKIADVYSSRLHK